MSGYLSYRRMRPYRRGSLMSRRWIRRLVYGRGHGIHSPLAFAMVHSLVRPYGRYYDYARIEGYASLEALLWYRIVARLHPTTIDYRLMKHEDRELLESMQAMAISHLHETGQSLMATDQVSEASAFLDEKKEAIVLLMGVRKDDDSERQFVSYLMSGRPHGIVLDLYDSAILLNNNYELYYYRTTL